MTDPKYKAQEKYNKEKTRKIAFRLNKERDKDVIELLDKASNKIELLRKAIREYWFYHKDEFED